MAGGTTRCAALVGIALALGWYAGPTAARAPEVGGFVGDRPSTAPGAFLQPRDVAVLHGRSASHSDDAILVLEGSPGRGRVQRLDSDGNLERSWGSDLDDPNALAVTQGSGDSYVVDSGNGRVVRYDRRGRRIGAWPLTVGEVRGGWDTATIAVAPAPPHHVFLGDERNDRVLQYDAGGRFLRAWGLGVVSGRRRFEVCSDVDRCRVGRVAVRFTRPRPRWPSQIAVDRRGVVYGSVFFGAIFEEQPPARTRILRFDSKPPPGGDDASGAVLAPLKPRPRDLYDPNVPETAYPTDGTTLGLDVDPETGRLFAINNPFGPSKLDVVSRPGTHRRHVTRAVDTLPFLQNVSGIAVLHGGDVTLLSSGAIREPTGASSFTGCAQPRVPHDCHGLVVLAPPGSATAIPAPSIGAAGAALVDPHGAVRYRFEVSRDGRAWRPVGRQRYLLGSGPRLVRPPLAALRRGVYRTRIAIERRTTLEGSRTARLPLGVVSAPSG